MKEINYLLAIKTGTNDSCMSNWPVASAPTAIYTLKLISDYIEYSYNFDIYQFGLYALDQVTEVVI